MNLKTIHNNILTNKNIIISSCTTLIISTFMVFYGFLNTILIFFGVILPVYNIINLINQIIPIKEKNLKKDHILSLTQWNLILTNHLILTVISNLIIFVSSFYLQVIQLGILYLLYKFSDSINTSFNNNNSDDLSDTINNNIILTDIILLINKTRVNLINSIISDYLSIFKNLNYESNIIEVFSNYFGTETSDMNTIIETSDMNTIIETSDTEEIKETKKSI